MTRPLQCARATRALVLSLSLLAPAVARAQGVDSQAALAAQALYDQAVAEMDASRYESACPRLEEVTRLAPTGLGAKLTLGECYERWGKLASAWSQYALVESLAPRAGQPERGQRAAEKAAALRPRLATLTIEVPEEVRSIPGLAITRDGVPVGAGQWAAPVPVDGGAHEIVARAPGRKPWTQQIEVADGNAGVARIPPLERDASPASMRSARSENVPGTGAKSERATGAPSGAAPWRRPVSFAALGLGAAGVAAGAVLGGLALAKSGESDEPGRCDAQDRCDPTGFKLRNSARALGDGATVAFIAGGALAAGGLTLLLTAPSSAGSEVRAGGKAPSWSALAALLPGGVAVQGSWW
ncbi:hypothetical protein WMF27_20390 [Sorangium sp. So ce281]|uniref:tetratricopeptide repeat protein n=1 Tax=unclassified Sorangium TaxID=2621164 RepID=UPI003F6198A9